MESILARNPEFFSDRGPAWSGDRRQWGQRNHGRVSDYARGVPPAQIRAQYVDRVLQKIEVALSRAQAARAALGPPLPVPCLFVRSAARFPQSRSADRACSVPPAVCPAGFAVRVVPHPV